MSRFSSKLSRLTEKEYPVSRLLLRSVVYSVETQEKALALTFDDGPTDNTEKLLEVLDANGAKGTFFNVGGKLERYKGLIQDLHRHGHELANHTWSHKRFNTLSIPDMLRELRRTNRTLKEITGVRPRFMRPPGKISTDFRNVLMRLCTGLEVVYDTYAPPDFQPDCPARLIRDGLVATSAPGSIVCMHDMFPHTREALAEALPLLREKGYRFLTLSELAATGKTSPYRKVMVPVQYREYTPTRPS